MQSNEYVADYTKTIVKYLRDNITYIPEKSLRVGFPDWWDRTKDSNGKWEYTGKLSVTLPAIACYEFDSNEMFQGLGRWMNKDKRGVRDQAIFIIEIWARNQLERDQIKTMVRRHMFEGRKHFQENGIRNIDLIRARTALFDPSDRIMISVSHVIAQVQRIMMTYRVTIDKIFTTESDGVGVIEQVQFEDETYGTWQTAGGGFDLFVNKWFNLYEDNIDLGVSL